MQNLSINNNNLSIDNGNTITIPSKVFVDNTNVGVVTDITSTITTGRFNTAVGTPTLQNVTSGTGNSAFGDASLINNTTGSSNSAYGRWSLGSNSTGSGNTAFGADALNTNTTGSNNTALGFQSGNNVTSGNNNLFLGYNSDASNNNTSSTNQIVIGANAVGNGDNTTTIGNSNTTNTYINGDLNTSNINATANITAGGDLTSNGNLTVNGSSQFNNNVRINTGNNTPNTLSIDDLGNGSGNQNVIVDANGKLMTTSMPATGQWTMTGNDISNNNSGNVIVTSDLVVDYNIDINGVVTSDLVVDYSSNLGIGINNPTFPLDINTSTNNTAAYITNFTPSNGTNWSDAKVGILSASYGTGSADNIGGEFLASGTGTGALVGVRGSADGANAATNFGILGESFGLSSQTNIGIYGTAYHGQNNWAGYFADGDVRIENKLVLNKIDGGTDNTFTFPTNRGTDGQVLSMSSTPGQLEWTSPSTGASTPWTISSSTGNIHRNIGKVGIANTNPKTSLHIGSSSNVTYGFGTTLLISGSGGDPGSSSTSRIYFENTSSTNNKLLAMAYGGSILRFATLSNSGSVWNTNGKILDLNVDSRNVKVYSDFEVGGNITFNGLGTASGQSGYEMIVADSTGHLYNMDMSGMGGHWSSDASGNPYVLNKKVGIGVTSADFPLEIDYSTNTSSFYAPASKITYEYTGSSSGIHSGLLVDATNSSNRNTHGIYVTSSAATSSANATTISIAGYTSAAQGAIGEKRGVEGTAMGNSGANNYGGFFSGSGAGYWNNNYGIYSSATGSGSNNYAIYGSASGGSNNWAGYFDSGNVKINNNLEIDGSIKIAGGTPGTGKVLVSDVNGNSSWENRSTNYTSLWIGSNAYLYLTTQDQKVNQGTLTFTKNHDNSVVECLFQSHIKHGDFSSSTARIRLNVYIIDQTGSTKTSTISDEVILTNGNTTSWVSFASIFDNLQSGTYTVEIRARMTNGSSNNFMIDPGNYGQRMVIKETF